ncbi:MAG: aldehyde dehydrogenase family protein [Acidimicrobiales bacterium]|nr:aldehyde dehydrogenase family protein [Acidimicrobiales bacterium]
MRHENDVLAAVAACLALAAQGVRDAIGRSVVSTTVSRSSVRPAPRLVVDGASVAGAAGTYPVTNPARPDEVVLDAPAASVAQLDAAVDAARRVQPAWAARTPAERTAAVVAAAAAGADSIEELAQLLTREHGKVLWEATFDIGTLSGMAAAFAPLVEEAGASRALPGGPGRRTVVERVPHGVVAAIIPFNWPVSVLGNKVLPALLAGNAVVVKPPPTCPGALLEAAAVLAAGLPAGLLNVISGPEVSLGQALVTHPGVDMVTFTGGIPAGRSVMAAAAATTKPVVLELGGNDPALLAPDLQIDEHLADRLVSAAFTTSGQVCMAIKRVYVPTGQKAALLEALEARLSREVVGDGLRPDVTMGPVHTAAARDRAEAMVAEAAAAGARIVRPATVVEEDAEAGGYLVSPALVDDPPPDTRIVADEQFAPVLPLLGYDDLDVAIAQANATPFGLCASVWTGDDDLAAAVSRRLEAGTIFVNDHGMAAMDHLAPLGGWKASGLGAELGPEGMADLTRARVVRGLADAGPEGEHEA